MLTMPLYIKGRDGSADALRKRAARKGWQSLGHGIYCEPDDDPGALAFSHWHEIVQWAFPDAIVSHRTAISLRPEKDAVFLTRPVSTYRNYKIGPLTISVTPGDVKVATRPIGKELHASDDARAWLENLSASRRRGGISRALGQAALEAELEKIMTRNGESYLKAVRCEANDVASQLGLEKEAARLDALIGGLCATRPHAGILKSTRAIARADREPFDHHVVGCFDALMIALGDSELPAIKVSLDRHSWRHQAFMESFFSNYIEGTQFLLSEAEEIVFDRRVDESRHADSHDILAVYDIAVDADEMVNTPSTPEEFRQLLTRRHAFLMHDRPDKRPGQWKEKPNQAGNIIFAAPESVNGTLMQGFERYLDVPSGFARAVFIHFVITQVHPFDDGNGRLARLFLSAELVSADESKIIIPNVKRDDYINGLRLANTEEDFRTMLKVMTQLYRYTAALPWRDYNELVDTLKEHHAFDDPDDGLIRFSRALRSMTSRASPLPQQ
jgi:hypothetical protein